MGLTNGGRTSEIECCGSVGKKKGCYPRCVLEMIFLLLRLFNTARGHERRSCHCGFIVALKAADLKLGRGIVVRRRRFIRMICKKIMEELLRSDTDGKAQYQRKRKETFYFF